MIDRNEKVDAPSDGLTFDDIPTASRRSQFYGNPHMPPQWRSTGTAMPTPQASQPINTGMAMPTPQASQPNNTGMAMPTPQASQPIYTGSPQQFVQQSTSQFYFFFAGFLIYSSCSDSLHFISHVWLESLGKPICLCPR